MADDIIARIPSHKIYNEPFFGGGAVFFAKPKGGIECINDFDEKVINFWITVQNDFWQLQNLISRSLHSETIHRFAKDLHYGRINGNDLMRAWAFWIVTNGSFGANAHGGWKWCNGTSGSHSAIMLRNKRENFTEKFYDRFRDVQISSRDAIKSIIDRDTADTFHYVDPPYIGANQGHYKGYTVKEFINLLDLLSHIKGKFILSNFSSQSLTYYIKKNGWNVEKFKYQMKIANLGTRVSNHQKKTTKIELLVSNFDSKQTTLFA